MEVNKKVYLSRQGFKFLQQYKVVIDQIQQGLVWIIVAVILLWGIVSLYQPVSTVQQQDIMTYQTQNLYPYTRELSEQLLEQDTAITQLQYYHFLRVLSHEQKRIQYQKDKDKE